MTLDPVAAIHTSAQNHGERTGFGDVDKIHTLDWTDRETVIMIMTAMTTLGVVNRLSKELERNP